MLSGKFIRKPVYVIVSLTCCFVVESCAKEDIIYYELETERIDTITVEYKPNEDVGLQDAVKVTQFASLGIAHQSAAAYGDYVVFVSNGRSSFHLFNLKTKSLLCGLEMKALNSMIYHCNQSSFGVEKFDPSDPFPLLYISQNAKTDQRCFIEVFRILPVIDEVQKEYSSFSIELIQTVFLPPMSETNSLGNVNCAIDSDNRVMYTYSRNNNAGEGNYGICKINQFALPDFHEEEVTLEDENILSSFMIDCKAFNMQGGCIKDGFLYIGQGYSLVGYIYLNVIELNKRKLVRRIDLEDCHVSWEPEGCFVYDGCLMLSHTSAISEIKIN